MKGARTTEPSTGVRSPGRPNVLWICTDQQRTDTVHALGNDAIDTPNLDALCADGTAFTRAYCQSPICTPSRASFLSGRYPSNVGVNRNGNETFPDDVQLISRALADDGYRCGLIGKLHLASPYRGVERRIDDGYDLFRYSVDPWQPVEFGNDYAVWLRRQGLGLADVFEPKATGGYRGYREDVDPAVHQTKWCADEAIAYIEAEHHSPWLLSVNIFDPHVPFDAPAAYRDRYLDGRPLPMPAFRESDLEQQERLADIYFQGVFERPNAQTSRRTASYYGMISFIDEQVGRMLEALDRTGQRENTLVVFMSDHGEMLGDHGLVRKGCRFYEGLVRVPLILSWPGIVQQGAVRDDLVELTDLAPTIAALTGSTLPRAQGVSLVPTLTAGRPHERTYVRSEYLDALNEHLPAPTEREHPERHRPSYGTMYCDGRYKLVTYHLHGTGELYDLQEDPDEFHDLWSEAADAKTRDLKAHLLQAAFDASMRALDTGPAAIGPY